MRYGLTGFPIGDLYGRVTDAPLSRVVRDVARAAEDAGFDFICGQDHIVTPRAWADQGAGPHWPDPFALLGFAAAATTTLRFLTDVLVMPYRSPFTVAKAGATLDALSDGRFILGLAAGYLEEEFDILQTEFDRRGDWTDEAIEVVKAAWTNEWFSHDGEFFRAHDVAVSPRPVQQPRPPIWIGGNSVRALRRAVEHGDGWTPFRGDPARLGQTLAHHPAPDGFAICAPIRGAVDHRSAREKADALAAVGVTHCKVAFRGPRLIDYLEEVKAFGSAVIASDGS